jgi:hypothetical protein
MHSANSQQKNGQETDDAQHGHSPMTGLYRFAEAAVPRCNGDQDG